MLHFLNRLTSIPLSLCSADGVMANTEKALRLNLLESRVEGGKSPKTLGPCIIDGQFLLHILPPHLPQTYGGLTRCILL